MTFPRVLDKLTNLTVLNLSNTGVSWNLVSKVKSDTCITYWETLKSSLSMQRDFTNTPHIDKLVNLTGKILDLGVRLEWSRNKTRDEAELVWEWDCSNMGMNWASLEWDWSDMEMRLG